MDRRRLFDVASLCDLVVENLRFYRDRGDFRLHAYVIMPDHLHLLLTPDRVDLSGCMRNLKSFIAKALHERGVRAGAVWQSRFHDRGIRGEYQFESAAEYIHMNPVKAGLAGVPSDFRYSSAGLYWGRGGLLGVDLPDGSRLGP
jgi:REP element-mobilizing transposase RayT